MYRLGVLIFLASTSAALAHPGHGGTGSNGFDSGFVHPLTGIDHLLAIFAIGFWASQLSGKNRWAIPVAFLGAMAGGGLIGMFGIALPLVEPGILVSILVLGILLAGAFRIPILAAVVFSITIAGLHGFAHGAEMPFSASALAYFSGFLLASAALTAFGFGLGIACERFFTPIPVGRLVGFALVVSSFALMIW